MHQNITAEHGYALGRIRYFAHFVFQLNIINIYIRCCKCRGTAIVSIDDSVGPFDNLSSNFSYELVWGCGGNRYISVGSDVSFKGVLFS